VPYLVEHKMGKCADREGESPSHAAAFIKIKPGQYRKNEEKESMPVYVPAAEGLSEEIRPDRFIDDIRQHRADQDDSVVQPPDK